MATTTLQELPIQTGIDATTMAKTMFGDGITVLSATYTGDTQSAGIFSQALAVSAGVVPADAGLILSTGKVVDFTKLKEGQTIDMMQIASVVSANVE